MMSPTNVSLYEALKPTVGEEAARMIAEVIPPAADLATKLDVAHVNERIAQVEAQIARSEASLRSEFASLLKWMIGLAIPVWAGTWATVVALLLKS